MIRWPLSRVAEVVGGVVLPAAPAGAGAPGAGEVHLEAVATDSRSLPPGDALFVTLRGERGDGHEHAEAAVAAGVVAVLAERALPDLTVPVVRVPDTWEALRRLAGAVRDEVGPVATAVTGSVGKTTVKDLAAAAVGAQRRVVASRGSFNNELGVPLTLLGLREDTEVLVTEIGARHEGDVAALAALVRPDVAIVTAVAAVHLEVFGSLAAIARAKGELVDALGPRGLAILHVGDPLVAAMASRAPAVLAVTADAAGPQAGDADVAAEAVHLDGRARAVVAARTPWGRVELRLPVAGRHQVVNGLLALALAGHLGIDLDAAAAGIETAEVSPWRGEIRDVDGVTVVDDAYNANPLAMRAALDTLLALDVPGARIAVLGVMAEIGPTAPREHEELGRDCAARALDQLVVVGEAARGIAHGAREAGLARVVEVPDAAAAVAALRRVLAPGDAVLVKASRVAGLEAVAEGLRLAGVARG